jgi:diphthamide synthase (EF-2-diphthine--ammonia ligase)
VASGVHAVLIKVACLGLKPALHLGKPLAAVQPLLQRLEDEYGCNACGEGGEYETLTLDCPLFKHGHIALEVRKVDACHRLPVARHDWRSWRSAWDLGRGSAHVSAPACQPGVSQAA